MTERLDDTRIKGLLNDASILKAFPGIAQIANKIKRLPKSVETSACKCNAKKKMQAAESITFAITEFKNYIIHMSQQDRERFKAALGATDIRLYVKDPTGVLREYRY